MNDERDDRDSRPATSWNYCPVEDLIEIVGGKWKPAILLRLRAYVRRFNELQRLMPACSPRMLALHLRELERDGLICRAPSMPQRRNAWNIR